MVVVMEGVVMVGYTPSTGDMRHYWVVQGVKRQSKRAKRAAEFDRWLAQVKAEAWEEGANSIFLANWHCCRARSTAIALSSSPDNPYRKETE